MNTYLLIYLLGCLIAAVLSARYGWNFLRIREITLNDLIWLLLIIVILGVGSWLTTVVVLLVEYGEKVVIKNK